MSSIIKFELKELRRLAAAGSGSCVEERRVTQSLALQPWCLANLKDSIKNLLDYKIGKFDKDLNGILLSYKNLRVLQNIGAIRNDNADIHFQIQADYFIFRPMIGATLRGIVNKKSLTHLGIIVHRVFNVVIPRPTEQPGNRWIGTRVREGQEVLFKIVMLDLFGALPYIRGELDERSLKAGPDGDDEPDTPIDKMTVSHVNFDKTKPRVLKQSGDGLGEVKVRSPPPKVPAKTPGNASKPLPKASPKPLTNTVVKESYTIVKEKPSDEKANDKKKQKRGRLSDGKPVEPQISNSTVRQFKKHKIRDN